MENIICKKIIGNFNSNIITLIQYVKHHRDIKSLQYCANEEIRNISAFRSRSLESSIVIIEYYKSQFSISDPNAVESDIENIRLIQDAVANYADYYMYNTYGMYFDITQKTYQKRPK